MTDTINRPSRGQEENEIDLMEIIHKLWNRRKFIFRVTLLFMLLGVLIAVFSAKEYTATCIMVPQTGGKVSGGNLSGLAAIAGINLANTGRSDVLSPKVYPKILASVPFQKELMQTPIRFKKYAQPISLLDYYTDEQYRKFSLWGTFMKYTVGLPGVILKAIRGKKTLSPLSADSLNSAIRTLSEKESKCMRILQDKVSLILNEKEGYVTLMADMSEPLAAAQLAARVQGLLQKYITEFKIEKAQANLDFIESRYQEAKEQFETKQDELAVLRDANRNFASAMARTAEERLSNEYNVALGVYSELAKQREQANIQVKENTPVFTIIEPVTVPTQTSKPQRGLICIAFTFLGAIIGVGAVLILPFIAQLSGSKRLKGWLAEEQKK